MQYLSWKSIATLAYTAQRVGALYKESLRLVAQSDAQLPYFMLRRHLSHLICFAGIAKYRAIPPKFALSQPRGGGGRGYRGSSCPLEGIALYGVIAEIVSKSPFLGRG